MAAGVPVVPATEVLPDDMAEVRRMAEAVGYPFMLKASWGGGGRGMRPVMGAGRARGQGARGPARGAERLRQRRGLPREADPERPPRRGAGPRRQARRALPPLGARLLGAAAQPEGRRARAGAVPQPGAARGALRARAEDRPGGGLRVRRHRRVPDGPRHRRLLLHRGQPAHPGRAHRHRGGDRHRHRPRPDPDRRGRDHRRGDRQPQPGRGQAERPRHPVPDHHRGPAEQLHPRLRPDHRLSRRHRHGHPARRRHRLFRAR